MMPRLASTQINVVGSPEAERQVQEMQDQLVHMAVDVKKLRAQFQLWRKPPARDVRKTDKSTKKRS
jgi:hypothetical protein